MRNGLAILVVSTFLGGCSKAGAAPPDSRNPAHCIASLTMAAAWNDADKSSRHPEYSAKYRAIAAYEVEKIRKSGGSVHDVIEQSVAFNHAYAKDPRVVDVLVGCLRAAAKDPTLKPLVPPSLLNDEAPSGK